MTFHRVNGGDSAVFNPINERVYTKSIEYI